LDGNHLTLTQPSSSEHLGNSQLYLKNGDYQKLPKGYDDSLLRDSATEVNNDLPKSRAGGEAEILVEHDRLKVTGQLGGWLTIAQAGGESLDLNIIPDYMLSVNYKSKQYPRLLIEGIIKSYDRIQKGNKAVLTRHLTYGDRSAFSITELLVGSFYNLAEKVLWDGLPRDYRSVSQRSERFIGQLVASKLIPDIWTSPHKLVQRMNEFTVNVPKNQLIRAGYDLLLDESLSTSIDLEPFTPFFEEVDAIIPEYDFVEELAFDHDGEEYHALLQLSDLILSLKGIKSGEKNEFETHKNELLPGFVFKAWDVYESLCVVMMREVAQLMNWEIEDLARGDETLAKTTTDDKTEKLQYKPDIVVTMDNEPIISIDAKCTRKDKVSDMRNYRNQVLVAANDLAASEAILLLPRTHQEQKRRTWKIESSSNWKTKHFSILYFDVPRYLDESTRESEVHALSEDLKVLLETSD
jgi:5-methylcytosine-specific restriction endonuclease McrBC regulatory subunit McrC